MRYRPEIDGMRTIAVLSVIFYHANFSMFSGGFIGVDIFFVISGFLITKVIRKEILVDNFSFLNFYEKRIRRIFPALFFVVLSSLIISVYVLPPVDAKHFFQSMFATITFSSNFLFWIQSGDYFDVGSIYKPLHHTWSLSLEEQFYLFHPFLLIFISKLKDYKQLIIIVLSIFISLTFSHFYLNLDLKGNFYLLPFRMWELFAGALLAFINLDKIRNKFSNMQQDIFACIGIAIVFISIFSFNPKTLHPSFITIAPILGSCIIIIFSTTKGLSGKLLSNKLSVYIGLISYFMALPNICFFSIYFNKKPI
jgi:peptidoglycan/LPS O-acetylase OafA/YrhL